MPLVLSKTMCDNTARNIATVKLKDGGLTDFRQIKNNTFATTVVDDNGDVRIVEVVLRVRKLKEDEDAAETFISEVTAYTDAQEEKRIKAEEKEAEKREKIKRDEAAREKKRRELQMAHEAKMHKND